MESDSRENPMGMEIVISVIRGMGIKDQKRFINVYILNYR